MFSLRDSEFLLCFVVLLFPGAISFFPGASGASPGRVHHSHCRFSAKPVGFVSPAPQQAHPAADPRLLLGRRRRSVPAPRPQCSFRGS